MGTTLRDLDLKIQEPAIWVTAIVVYRKDRTFRNVSEICAESRGNKSFNHFIFRRCFQHTSWTSHGSNECYLIKDK